MVGLGLQARRLAFSATKSGDFAERGGEIPLREPIIGKRDSAVFGRQFGENLKNRRKNI